MPAELNIDIPALAIFNPLGQVTVDSNGLPKLSSKSLATQSAWLLNHAPNNQHISPIPYNRSSENILLDYRLYFLEKYKYINFKLNIINIFGGNLTPEKELTHNKELKLNQATIKFLGKLNELIAQKIYLTSRDAGPSQEEYNYFLNEVGALFSAKKELDELEEKIELEIFYLDSKKINLNESENYLKRQELEKNRFLKKKNN